MLDENTQEDTTAAPSPTDAVTQDPPKKPLSIRKIEANRQNGLRSTGPTTQEGKTKSSQNAITHGIFAKQFFAGATPETLEEMKKLAAGLWAHYQPVGTIEEMLVEKLCIEAARYSRILKLEQQELAREAIFFNVAADRVGRYGAGVNRELYRVMEQLERIQSERKARSSSSGSAEPDAEGASVERDDAAAAPTDAS